MIRDFLIINSHRTAKLAEFIEFTADPVIGGLKFVMGKELTLFDKIITGNIRRPVSKCGIQRRRARFFEHRVGESQKEFREVLGILPAFTFDLVGNTLICRNNEEMCAVSVVPEAWPAEKLIEVLRIKLNIIHVVQYPLKIPSMVLCGQLFNIGSKAVEQPVNLLGIRKLPSGDALDRYVDLIQIDT